MHFGANKTPVEVIKEGACAFEVELILEAFILVLMVSGIESHKKNLMG